ncbi:MAG TPA: hypothetical protein VKH35_12920 [Thermoanaerobaculia bacterium]|nr:hypothetical protein [Thermoanaerobaculia bacterium]
MNLERVEKIVNAVLYEGYILYPYRASSIKNRQRWNFGVLYPPSWCARQKGSDASSLHSEFLVRGDADVFVRLRFLRIVERAATGTFPAWQEAEDREIGGAQTFSLEAGTEEGRRYDEVRGAMQVRTTRIADRLFRIAVDVENRTDLPESATRDEALLRSLASAHLIITAERGELISLLDPPPELAEAAAACRNAGVFPVLAGDEGDHDVMLASPIILYDHPRVAPESPGDLYDGTEIDEILSLRIRSLTEDEKREIRGLDERARRLLDRTESLTAADLMALHGTIRPGEEEP